MELTDKEKSLLEKLKKASKKDIKFSLTLTIDDEILSTREFSANQFSKESIVTTRTHFLMNDLIRFILKNYEESESTYQEEKKKKEIEQLWKQKENKKDE